MQKQRGQYGVRVLMDVLDAVRFGTVFSGVLAIIMAGYWTDPDTTMRRKYLHVAPYFFLTTSCSGLLYLQIKDAGMAISMLTLLVVAVHIIGARAIRND